MTRLKLGSIELWRPPQIAFELTGSRNNYAQNACGSTLESTELTYRLFIGHMCTLAEAQQIQLDIEDELALAPNLILTRQDTPDALIFQNTVTKGSLTYSSDQTELRARFTRNRTLALALALTILPGTPNAIIPFTHTRFLYATGGLDWRQAGDNIDILLYDATSTAPDELYVQTLDDFVDLGEIINAGYARDDVVGRDVIEGVDVEMIADDVTFTGIADDAEQIAGAILFQNNGSDATNVPLFLVPLTLFDPGGNPFTVRLNLAGLV